MNFNKIAIAVTVVSAVTIVAAREFASYSFKKGYDAGYENAKENAVDVMTALYEDLKKKNEANK
jgi:hypothetical protein